MSIPVLMSAEEIGKIDTPVVLGSVLSSPYIAFGLQAWVPQFYQWRSIESSTPTTFDGQQPMLFEIDTVDLPIAARRWKIDLPEHPQVTFDDLRAGKWSKPTEEELKARGKALELARSVHEKLDIRPLTTATMIRQLREGIEERE